MWLGLAMRFPVGSGADITRKRYEEYFSGFPSIVPGWKPSCFLGKAAGRYPPINKNGG
jgi:hypothetical protein